MFQVGLRKLHPMYRLAANFTDHEIHLSCKLLDLVRTCHTARSRAIHQLVRSCRYCLHSFYNMLFATRAQISRCFAQEIPYAARVFGLALLGVPLRIFLGAGRLVWCSGIHDASYVFAPVVAAAAAPSSPVTSSGSSTSGLFVLRTRELLSRGARRLFCCPSKLAIHVL